MKSRIISFHIEFDLKFVLQMIKNKLSCFNTNIFCYSQNLNHIKQHRGLDCVIWYDIITSHIISIYIEISIDFDTSQMIKKYSTLLHLSRCCESYSPFYLSWLFSMDFFGKASQWVSLVSLLASSPSYLQLVCMY